MPLSWKEGNQTGRMPQRIAAAVLACTVLLGLSAPLTWVSASVGDGAAAFSLLTIPLAPLVLGGATALIAGGALATLTGRDGGLELASVVALGLVVLFGVFIACIESIAALVPDDAVPVTVRRLTLGAGAGAGAWMAFAAALAIVLATAPRARVRVLAGLGALRARGPLAAASVAVLLMAIYALVQLRQEAWVQASALGGTLRVDGLALPVIAPATFAAGWLLAGGVALACVGLWELGGLVAAAAGWLANVAAATTIACAQTLADLDVTDVHAAPAAWLTFALGLAAAAAGAALLQRGEGV